MKEAETTNEVISNATMTIEDARDGALDPAVAAVVGRAVAAGATREPRRRRVDAKPAAADALARGADAGAAAAPFAFAALPDELAKQIGQRAHAGAQYKKGRLDPNARDFDEDLPSNFKEPSLDE